MPNDLDDLLEVGKKADAADRQTEAHRRARGLDQGKVVLTLALMLGGGWFTWWVVEHKPGNYGLLFTGVGMVVVSFVVWGVLGWMADQQRTSADGTYPRRPAGDADAKTCPDCAETVKAAARKCRFCGHVFDESAA